MYALKVIEQLSGDSFYNENGREGQRYRLRVEGKSYTLEIFEPARFDADPGDFLAFSCNDHSDVIHSWYLPFRNQSAGPDRRRLKRLQGIEAAKYRKWQGIVDHKRMHSTRDDMSREGYSTAAYYDVRLQNGHSFIVNEQEGKGIRPGDEVLALITASTGQGERVVFFRNITKSYQTHVPLSMLIAGLVLLVAAIPAVGFAIQAVGRPDLPQTLILLIILSVPVSVLWSYFGKRADAGRYIRLIERT